MKTSMLVALMTENFALVEVKFRKTSKSYFYKAPLDWQVKVGDTCVVDTPYGGHEGTGGFDLVTVVSVDNEPVLDANADYSYKWIVQKVDDRAYRAHGEKEKFFHKHLNRLRNKALAENELERMRAAVAGTTAAKELEEALQGIKAPMADTATSAQIQAPSVSQVQTEPDDIFVMEEFVYDGRQVRVLIDRPYTNKYAYRVDGGIKVTGFVTHKLARDHAVHSINTGAK